MIIVLVTLIIFSITGFMMSRDNKLVKDIFSIGFFNLWIYFYIAWAVKLGALQITNILIAIFVVTLYTVAVMNKYRKK